jgi:hypothetical protein
LYNFDRRAKRRHRSAVAFVLFDILPSMGLVKNDLQGIRPGALPLNVYLK